MFNKIYKEDYDRVIVTDTSPADVPLILSNDGFYFNLKKLNSKSKKYIELINKLIIENKKPTVPIIYTIRNGNDSIRRLSLAHPCSQYQMRLFYEKYSEMVCYFTNKSPFSIRYPKKISGTFFKKNKNNNINLYKNGGVEHSDDEKVNKHSVSFFSYGGYDRIHKFLKSNEFISLEKEYGYLFTLDVSKCFESIYTHSLPWATKDKEHIKRHTSVKSMFGQQFDMLMQRSNQNETNGIIIGPEISRIFSEIILQRIDNNCIKGINYDNNKDYTVRRYVDDTFIFAKTEKIAGEVFNKYVDELRRYNLHINNSKTKKYTRPFITKKSLIALKLNDKINEFSEKIYDFDDDNNVIIKKIYDYRRFSNNFIDNVKAICLDLDCKYDDVSLYIIASMSARAIKIIDLIKDRELSSVENNNLKNILLSIINISFHFYTVSPNVKSSYILGRCCLIVSEFIKNRVQEYSDTINHNIFNLTRAFFSANGNSVNSNRDYFLTLENVNVLLFSSELGYEYQYTSDEIDKILSMNSDTISYFQIISYLFYIKGFRNYEKERKNITEKISKFLRSNKNYIFSSESTHLFLDVMSCPYFENNTKKTWLKNICQTLSIKVSDEDVEIMINEFDDSYWFVDWNGINLINILEKKLLKSNY